MKYEVPHPAILAKSNGWLIAVKVLAETKKSYTVIPTDSKNAIRVKKDDPSAKLFFNGSTPALEWIEAQQPPA